MTLPTDPAARKAVPIYSGFIKYFPRAICAVAELSRIGNDQHNPGQPLHWDRAKSRDELDALMRHLMDDAMGVPTDTDNVLHATKLAWRAMANLEKALEEGERQAQLAVREIGEVRRFQGKSWNAHGSALHAGETMISSMPDGLSADTPVRVLIRANDAEGADLAGKFNWTVNGDLADIMWWRHAD